MHFMQAAFGDVDVGVDVDADEKKMDITRNETKKKKRSCCLKKVSKQKKA